MAVRWLLSKDFVILLNKLKSNQNIFIFTRTQNKNMIYGKENKYSNKHE